MYTLHDKIIKKKFSNLLLKNTSGGVQKDPLQKTDQEDLCKTHIFVFRDNPGFQKTIDIQL